MVERKKGPPQQGPIPERQTPLGLIDALARRDLRARSMTTGELAAEFQTAIEESGAFSWIGIYEHQDDLGMPSVEVYLAERDDRMAAARERVVDVVDTFDDLSLSLKPNWSSHLHLIPESVVTQRRQELESRSDGPGAYRLVLEEQIPPLPAPV